MNIKTIVGALFIVALAGAAQAADTYVFDPAHTSVTWHANHFGFSNPSGKFAGISGSVTLDEEKPENSSVEATIDMNNMVTGTQKFDEHLKSPDFFSVVKFPSATFKSDKVEVTGEHTAKVTGTLTLLGVAKPVTLDVTLNKVGPNPFTDKKMVGFSATTTIKRSDWDIKYGIPDVSDDVQLAIEAEVNTPPSE